MRNPNNASKPAQNTTNTNVPPANNGAPSAEAYALLLAKVTELQSKVDRKKRQDGGSVTDNGLKLVTSEKGAVSVYGLGRFPVTLYASQMVELLDAEKDIRQFIVDNAATLKTKAVAEDKKAAA